ILAGLKGATYQVESIEKKETKRNPLPPFTTSTLQQTAANKFGFSSKFTMSLAQKLYEEGNITYHRTDSLNLSAMSVMAAKEFITKEFGAPYWAARAYKAKGKAQEAHEAIRPTYPSRTPNSLKTLPAAQQKLYRLIWQRFMASQMASARFDAVSVDIQAARYGFAARGQMLRFDGFLKVYPMQFTETDLPVLQKNETLELKEIIPSQHFTEPPARYNEASLIKALEAHGIGRPSTYAPTLATIQDRHYVEKNEQRRFVPTEIGTLVNDMLVKNFPEIVDIGFTSQIEEQLDAVAEGQETWQKACADFYNPFSKNLKEKYQEVKKEKLDIATDK
ncbi:MAG: DNA topoisomerase, partial [Candidatus Saccharimonadales bacterium]